MENGDVNILVNKIKLPSFLNCLQIFKAAETLFNFCLNAEVLSLYQIDTINDKSNNIGVLHFCRIRSFGIFLQFSNFIATQSFPCL